MKYGCLILCLIAVTVRADQSWPLVYNQGVTAYQSNDFSSAATSFERATASPEQALQERAFYNLGNTYYRIGQAAEAQGPEQALKVFKRSLKGFEEALKLNPQDADARFNRDLVKKKIEELQKKQEEQKQQQQQKQDQQKQNQQKKEDQKQDQQQQRENQNQNQKKDQQQQNQDQNNEQQKKQQEQQRRQQDKEKQQSQDQKNPQDQQQQQQAGQTNQLQKTQAQVMLDNMREDERNWNFFPEVQMKDLKDSGQPVKDW